MEHLTYQTFPQAISKGVVVVDFYATRCGPCKMIAPYLEELAEHLKGRVTFYKVDVDEQRMLTGEQGITGMPTFKIFQEGKEINEIRGADMQGLVKALQPLVE